METQDTEVLAPTGTAVSYDPTATATLYMGQVLILTVIVKGAAANDIPSGSSVTLTPGPGFLLNTDITDSWTQPVVSADQQNGKAVFALNITPNAKLSDLHVKPTFQGVKGSPPSDIMSYTILEEAVNAPIISGPSSIYVPVPPDSSPTPLTPSADEYTIMYTATVTDSKNKPVPNYIVDWHEVGRISIGLFTNLVYTYLKNDDTTPLQYDPGAVDPNVIKSRDGKIYVRTMTDSKGVARIYLVANNSNTNEGTAAARISAWSQAFKGSMAAGFIVGDLDTPHIQVAPEVDGIDPTTGTLDYDSIIGANVPVDIQLNNIASDSDVIYTFINGEVADTFLWKNSGTIPYNTSFAKVMGYSDNGANANKENQLTFILGSSEKGSAHTGATITFKGTGNRGNNIPTPGNLDEPWLKGHTDIINWETVQEASIQVMVPMAAKDGSWTAAIGDSITARADLNGYKPHSDTLKDPITVVSANYFVQKIDITKGYALISLSTKKFHDWGQMKDPPNTEGTCYITYKVVRDGKTWNSQVLTTVLNTVLET